MTNEEWYILNNAKIWLRSIVHQGQRLLINQQRMQDAMQAITLKNLMQHQDYLEYNDLRIAEEHFFVISVSKATDWLKEAKKFRLELSSEIDMFFQSLPEAKDLRNMREHDIEYFKGEGNAQKRFVKTLEDITIDASASISNADGYLIGGRLNVQRTMRVAQRLYLMVEKAALEIHEVD